MLFLGGMLFSVIWKMTMLQDGICFYQDRFNPETTIFNFYIILRAMRELFFP